MSVDQTSRDEPWLDPLFKTGKLIGLTEMWDRVQRNQVEYGFAQELVAYYSSDTWLRSESVLDLGTGNGHYLQRLAAYFPGKRYHGIDISEELITIARSRAPKDNIRFEQCDLSAVTGSYDFVIMRLFLQHMPDVNAALDKVAGITKPGGSALVIDSYLPRRLFQPEVPEVMKFLAAYKEQQASLGLDRNIAVHLDEAVGTTGRWTIGDRLTMIYPTTFPGMLDLYRESIYLMIEIIERTKTMEYDFDKVRKDWDRWCSRDDAYAQVGVCAVRLDRGEANR